MILDVREPWKYVYIYIYMYYIYIYHNIYIYILDIMDNHQLLWFTRGDHVPHLLVPSFPRRRRPSFPGSPAAQCAPATKSPLAPPRRTRCSSRHWIVTRRSSWEIYGENVGKCSIIHIKHGWNMLKFQFLVFYNLKPYSFPWHFIVEPFEISELKFVSIIGKMSVVEIIVESKGDPTTN